MLKWQDPLSLDVETRLKNLAENLRLIKAPAWSVIFSGNEIIVRPEERTLGKFSTSVQEEKLVVTFFSRELNIWNKRRSFSDAVGIEREIKEWMESQALEPLKRWLSNLFEDGGAYNKRLERTRQNGSSIAVTWASRSSATLAGLP